MVTTDSDFLKKLLSTFKVEAEEHVGAMSAGLLALEKASAPDERRQIVETIFREAHSLKGAARSVNASQIEKICQPLESVFAALKREEIVPTAELFDTLHQAVDLLSRLLSTLDAGATVAAKKQVAEFVRRLQDVPAAPLQKRSDVPTPVGVESSHTDLAHLINAPSLQETAVSSPVKEDTGATAEQLKVEDATTRTEEGDGSPREAVQVTDEKPQQAKTIRIATAKLDALLLQSEELLSAKLTAQERLAELREMRDRLATWKKEWAKVQADARALAESNTQAGEHTGQRNGQGRSDGKLTRLIEFLHWNSRFIKSLETELAGQSAAVEQDARALGSMVDEHLEDVKKALMLPASSLLNIFPKVVRDLARDRGKEIELVLEGGETEVDRRILEELKDPLLHLVRNAVDHGIEEPAERTAKNKPARGTLALTVTQKSGSEFEILVADDGRGIDARRVKAAAVKSGAASPEEMERLDEREALSLIFRSGVSTSPIITDISGRGLGLAILQEKVEKLGGALSLKSQPGAGTTFRIRVPLTLATFRGILVRAGNQNFMLPTTGVKRVMRVREEEIRRVENRETINFDGQLISLVGLASVLGLKPATEANGDSAFVHAVVLGVAEARIGFVVDEILGEQEVLVKSLGRQLARVRNIAGATVLGSGQVVPVLNISDLMRSAAQSSRSPIRAAFKAEKDETRSSAILIAEDSITARTLLKSILESAGYVVKATVDGVEALTELRAGRYDLLVSDVEMPRMGGFELTAKVREDKKLSELPVVLVTSLDSREDRERGIDVGANAYIVKSSFDQSNLLEIVRRLI